MLLNIYCIAQLDENITNFRITVYVASSHVVNQQKVYDTVVERDLSRQKSHTCAEAVSRR